ncbi:ABC transporter ATP-binding protein [Rhodoplanes sp. TEM]|uniref:ABC transporter ATP-binding protein n=1 Tax=Rhodoplanes tepidamans TaxID=200616 RepID=A0ABT5JD69_RHOTP|nr:MULTISPECIES: ABC transporter ATP-binding protein [Rhodoplanes]MDC7787559.1 ABC transporter ATP-binding protein [Rhodoplanes tepidamans]MDC7984948.1 ABC transporter ATP-binding protein [Rhodoplanes sp. TEM]MDQ0357988.1 branched-chain amino acid transport system ATP-binding protein [Rhodoplanes tepidamans]
MEPAIALETRGLTKRFGGLVAVDGVSFSLRSGRVNAIIGPNGAGKTTLFNLVTGELRPDDGEVLAAGVPITGLPPHRIVREGVSRTLQIKSVFGGLTVADNVRAAVMAHQGIRSAFRPAASYRAVGERVDALIDEVGLARHRDRKASALSYGDVALLELALALAAEPKLLLLDEPVCGMGPEETERAVARIRAVASKVDVVIIEHDMEVVFSLASHIVVMASGAILAEGTPDEISRDPRVQEAYLGAPEDDE